MQGTPDNREQNTTKKNKDIKIEKKKNQYINKKKQNIYMFNLEKQEKVIQLSCPQP